MPSGSHRVKLLRQPRPAACSRKLFGGKPESSDGRMGSQRQHPFSPREPLTKHRFRHNWEAIIPETKGCQAKFFPQPKKIAKFSETPQNERCRLAPRTMHRSAMLGKSRNGVPLKISLTIYPRHSLYAYRPIRPVCEAISRFAGGNREQPLHPRVVTSRGPSLNTSRKFISGQRSCSALAGGIIRRMERGCQPANFEVFRGLGRGSAVFRWAAWCVLRTSSFEAEISGLCRAVTAPPPAGCRRIRYRA